MNGGEMWRGFVVTAFLRAFLSCIVSDLVGFVAEHFIVLFFDRCVSSEHRKHRPQRI